MWKVAAKEAYLAGAGSPVAQSSRRLGPADQHSSSESQYC